MKSLTEYLTFNLPERMGFVNITPRIEEIVTKSGVREGLLLANAMHITASVFINDDEPGLHADYKKWLEELAPFDPSPSRYKHAYAIWNDRLTIVAIMNAPTGQLLSFLAFALIVFVIWAREASHARQASEWNRPGTRETPRVCWLGGKFRPCRNSASSGIDPDDLHDERPASGGDPRQTNRL